MKVVNFTISFLRGFLKINGIGMYSTYNEGKSVAGERLIRTLKSKIFKHMTAVSENVYSDVFTFRIEKVLKRKGEKCTSNGKGMIIYLIVGLIKKIFNKFFEIKFFHYK